ncbi:MAG: hypothetical protein WD069_10865 [Planctomycetales bacterium]
MPACLRAARAFGRVVVAFSFVACLNGAGPAESPANRWVERKVAGLEGDRVTNRGGLVQGLLAAPGLGIVACGDSRAPARVWRLDWEQDRWVELGDVPEGLKAPGEITPYNWGPLATGTAADGRLFPFNVQFHGHQAAYDPERKTIVGFTRGKTLEYDLERKAWRIVETKTSPPDITAGSLCWDPLNKEMVLATGGFGPDGGLHGTWVYRAAEQNWAKLDESGDPRAEVAAAAAKLHDRLRDLRWLAWKNLEYRTTGREAQLDARSRTAELLKALHEFDDECGRLAAKCAAVAKTSDDDAVKRTIESAKEALDATRELAQAYLAASSSGAEPKAVETAYREKLVPAVAHSEQAAEALAVRPTPRMSARTVYDPASKSILCFGGDRQDGTWGDTWRYDCAARRWQRLDLKGHPEPQVARAVAFDRGNGVLVFLGSNRQLWTFGSQENRWDRVDVAASSGGGVEPPAEAFWLEYDDDAKCLVAFSEDLKRTWTLRLELQDTYRQPAQPAPDRRLVSIDGEFVLRDAGAFGELRVWQALNDDWRRRLPANTWAHAPAHGSGLPNWGRSWSSITYDPDRRQLYYRDGGHGSYHGADTDHYDLTTGRWFRGDRREEPPWPMGTYFAWGRSFDHAPWATHTYKFKAFYDPVDQRLRRLDVPTPTPTWDSHAGTPALDYDPDTGRWDRDVVLLPKAAQNGSWFPVFGTTDRVLLTPFGRNDSGAGVVWEKTAGDDWKKHDGVGAFGVVGYPPWEFQVACYDPQRRRILRMGSGQPPNELWALELDEPGAKWKQLRPQIEPAGAPLPESGREMVYVPKHDLFVMPDGITKSSYRPDKVEPRKMDELCVYDPAKNVWRRFRTKFAEEARGLAERDGSNRANGMVYDEAADLIYFISYGYSEPRRPPTLCALRFDPATADWIEADAE